jgi:hypothetical protein
MWSTDFELQGEDILKNSTIRFCEVLGIDQKYVDIVKNYSIPRCRVWGIVSSEMARIRIKSEGMTNL